LYFCNVNTVQIKIAFLLLILSAAFVSHNSLYYSYLFDNVAFIEKHCINKDKPELECKGSCKIKELSEQKSQDQEIPIQDQELPMPILYLENLEFSEKPFFIERNGFVVIWKNAYSFDLFEKFAPPPQNAA